jgi:hypothetical protein
MNVANSKRSVTGQTRRGAQHRARPAQRIRGQAHQPPSLLSCKPRRGHHRPAPGAGGALSEHRRGQHPGITGRVLYWSTPDRRASSRLTEVLTPRGRAGGIRNPSVSAVILCCYPAGPRWQRLLQGVQRGHRPPSRADQSPPARAAAQRAGPRCPPPQPVHFSIGGSVMRDRDERRTWQRRGVGRSRDECGQVGPILQGREMSPTHRGHQPSAGRRP